MPDLTRAYVAQIHEAAATLGHPAARPHPAFVELATHVLATLEGYSLGLRLTVEHDVDYLARILNAVADATTDGVP